MSEQKFYDRATGKEFDMPAEGSLGLLALGDVTVKPWRQKRIETGYEKELIERIKKQKEEAERLKEEMKRKREAKKNEQQKS